MHRTYMSGLISCTRVTRSVVDSTCHACAIEMAGFVNNLWYNIAVLGSVRVCGKRADLFLSGRSPGSL